MPNRSANDGAAARRAAAWGGATLAAAGVIGLLVLPSFAIIWVVLLFFAVAVVPRLVFDWLAERRRTRR